MENGAFEFLPNGNEWTCGRPAIKIGCEGGYLLACQAGDPSIYDEVSVDFVSDDGRLVQLACVGMDEGSDKESLAERRVWEPEYQPMHVYAWNGIDEDVASTQYVTISEDSRWYEK